MRRYELSDDKWNRIEHLLPSRAGDAGGYGADNRLFVNAVIWIACSGTPWRNLPERLGLWNSVFQRFNRWAKSSVWEQVYEAIMSPDLKALSLDSAVIRVHQHAAGALKKTIRLRPS